MATDSPSRAGRVARAFCSLRLTTAGLLYLAFLVVWGTVYQSRSGLYAAQARVFNSWIFWAGGFFPLPGMRTVGAILLLNLLAASLFTLRYRWRQSGLILIHYGLILLVTGGFYSGCSSEESHLTLAEGESSGSSASFREWEVALSLPGESGNPLLAVDPVRYPTGKGLEVPGEDASIHLLRYHRNCLPSVDGSRIVGLRARPLDPDPANDRPGGRFALVIRGVQGPEFFLWSGSRKPYTLTVGNRDLQVRLQPKRLPLPFSVKLVDFIKSVYPGTDVARRYTSRVEIAAGGVRYEAEISMNKPLHRGGFTLYQSSYGESDLGEETSILAVVKNQGRLLPYLATLMTFLGLVLHFLLRLLPKKRIPREA